MSRQDPLGTAHDQRVTASDLVRQFGVWQDRAARAPVYILHRGRPRLVLASIELMDVLCTSRSVGGDESRMAALLDAAAEPIVLADRDARIIGASRSARGLFGQADAGLPVGAVARGDGGALLAATVVRVARTGRAEALDLVPAARPDRRLACAVEPVGDGAGLFARDVTDEELADRLLAERSAASEAMTATMLATTARIGPRGYLESPDAGLAAFTGVAVETLATTRFATLIEIGSRVAVTETIERVFDDGIARGLDATLLVAGAAPAPIRIGLAAIRRRGAVNGLTAMLARVRHDA